MTRFPALLLLPLLAACSHPLHISGEGDIISSNGRHNCFLEEQPCENLVTGDYFVTYTAEPREGWNFDGWDGCGDQFPQCTINVPSARVAQSWGETMPALTAAFSRDRPRSKVLIIFDNSGSMNTVAPDETDKTRLDIAKEVVTDVVSTNTSIDFGLSLFNHNSDGSINAIYNCFPTICLIYNSEEDNGGRIVKHLKDNMTAEDRVELAGSSGIINGITAGGSTPLSETTYEVYRYLSGRPPLYGLKQDIFATDYLAGYDPYLDSPDYDPEALQPGLARYNSPAIDCAPTYVILLTDGLPSLDTHANEQIETEFGVTCPEYAIDGGAMEKNCLAELTRYMANNDLDNNPNNGHQFGITYTIGFTVDQQLLYDAAIDGKGEYFFANSGEELSIAFSEVIEDISNQSNNTCEGVF